MVKSMNLNFEMYADVRFNRPVIQEEDYISPGGYEMTMSGEIVKFDFERSGWNVDLNNPYVVHISQTSPDYSYIKQHITKDMLKHVENIEEFFVFTGEPGETDLKPVAVENITFVIPDDGWKDVHVKGNVCKAANVCCNL